MKTLGILASIIALLAFAVGIVYVVCNPFAMDARVAILMPVALLASAYCLASYISMVDNP